MKRLLALGSLLVLLATTLTFAADKKEPDSPKAALQLFGDFIGEWKGNGGPLPAKSTTPAKDLWTETVNWGWRFKKDDVFLNIDIQKGKYYKSGEVRYLPEKKKYQLTLVDLKDQKTDFLGQWDEDKERFVFEATDDKTKETQQITMNLAAEGVRMIFTFSKKPEGRTIFTPVYQVAATRAGESLGARDKKNVCVVSGGLGTMAVSYKGTTYYVCCTGCRDAFNENPEKYIKEFEAKKKMK